MEILDRAWSQLEWRQLEHRLESLCPFVLVRELVPRAARWEFFDLISMLSAPLNLSAALRCVYRPRLLLSAMFCDAMNPSREVHAFSHSPSRCAFCPAALLWTQQRSTYRKLHLFAQVRQCETLKNRCFRNLPSTASGRATNAHGRASQLYSLMDIYSLVMCWALFKRRARDSRYGGLGEGAIADGARGLRVHLNHAN